MQSFPLEEITLVKPSKWSIGSLEAVVGRSKSADDELVKYVIYYALSRDDRRKYSFDQIGTLTSEVYNNLFLNLINADAVLLQEVNASQTAKNFTEAVKILKDYLNHVSTNLCVHVLAMLLHSSIAGAWISALDGDLKDKAEKLSDLSSSFRKMAAAYPAYVKSIKDAGYLIEFDSHKEDFLCRCNRLNRLVEKVRSIGMWFPSRYSSIAMKELLTMDPSQLDRRQLELIICGYVDADIDEKILPAWKEAILFSGREQIIEEALKAHQLSLFAPAITCLLTQLDYIIVEIARVIDADRGHRNANKKMITAICAYIERIVHWNMPITRILNESDIGQQLYFFQLISLVNYLKDVVFEDTQRVQDNEDTFNRHGIIHGIFSIYPGSMNSTKLILLIDDLIKVYKSLPQLIDQKET